MFSNLVAGLLLCGSTLGSPFHKDNQPFSQEFRDNQNVLKYVANRGPYSDRRSTGLSRDPPAECRVDQVVMLARHGERWPSTSSFKSQVSTMDKVRAIPKHSGSLDFVDTWEYFADSSSGWLEQETLMGPYSGLYDAYYHGALYRRRYGHLYDGTSPLPLFLSAYQRDVDTGRKFGQGFLSWNYTDLAAVNFILEDNGANSLSPNCNGKDKTTCASFTFPMEFTNAANRLNNENPGMNLNASDIFQLLDVAGYELNVRGNSPWINVFTSDEWVAYEYYVTSTYYCSTGPGSKLAPVIGSVFLKGARDLLVKGPAELPLAFSFAHDTDILKVVAAMGIDSPADPKSWDPTQTQFNQRYTMSDIVPQGARLVFERLSCNPGTTVPAYINQYPAAFNQTEALPPNNSTQEYVRVVLNEAVVPLDGCSNGPGSSCSLTDFDNWVKSKTKKLDFVKKCKISKDQPRSFDVFTNYTTSNMYNADNAFEPYRAKMLNSTGEPAK